MTCEQCGATLTDQIVDICVCESIPARMIAGVPALVCPRCDSRVFSGDVALRIDDIRDRFADPNDYDGMRQMLVYNYATERKQGTLPFALHDLERMAGVSTLVSANPLRENTGAPMVAQSGGTAAVA